MLSGPDPRYAERPTAEALGLSVGGEYFTRNDRADEHRGSDLVPTFPVALAEQAADEVGPDRRPLPGIARNDDRRTDPALERVDQGIQIGSGGSIAGGELIRHCRDLPSQVLQWRGRSDDGNHWLRVDRVRIGSDTGAGQCFRYCQNHVVGHGALAQPLEEGLQIFQPMWRIGVNGGDGEA